MSEPAQSVDEVLALYDRWGPERYDEEVTQLEHALQCAALARDAGAPDALVVASLLHDVGHLLELAGGRFRSDVDEHHEARGAKYLSALFGRDVTEPIALHVRAKRYLCAVDAGYAAALSTGSTISLAKQGGPMTTAEATAFERQPGSEAAVQLRRWDDEAKVLDLDVGTLDRHLPLLQRVARALT